MLFRFIHVLRFFISEVTSITKYNNNNNNYKGNIIDSLYSHFELYKLFIFKKQ
jgi:hypothetical protein